MSSETETAKTTPQIIIIKQGIGVWGILSLIFGILSIPIFTIIFAPLAFLMGFIGLIRPGIAGKIMSGVGILCGFIGVLTSPMLMFMIGLGGFSLSAHNAAQTPPAITQPAKPPAVTAPGQPAPAPSLAQVQPSTPAAPPTPPPPITKTFKPVDDSPAVPAQPAPQAQQAPPTTTPAPPLTLQQQQEADYLRRLNKPNPAIDNLIGHGTIGQPAPTTPASPPTPPPPVAKQFAPVDDEPAAHPPTPLYQPPTPAAPQPAPAPAPAAPRLTLVTPAPSTPPAGGWVTDDLRFAADDIGLERAFLRAVAAPETAIEWSVDDTGDRGAIIVHGTPPCVRFETIKQLHDETRIRSSEGTRCQKPNGTWDKPKVKKGTAPQN